MALNIKSAEAHRLARKLAEARDTTLTEAVTQALAASLGREPDDLEPRLLLSEVREIQAFVAGLPDRDGRAPEDLLGYDELGLPA